MKRWMIVAVASVLAVGTGGFLAIRSNRSDCGQPRMVSKVDIPPNADLNPYIAAGDFRTACVTTELVVADVVVNIRELQNQRTSAAIYANEQIPFARLGTG